MVYLFLSVINKCWDSIYINIKYVDNIIILWVWYKYIWILIKILLY